MSLCKVSLIGNLGRDPEMRYTPDGRPVTQFSVAVNRNSKNQAGEWVEETEWFRITVWGNQAERTAENLKKGSKIYVEGRFRTREWEAQDGQKRTALEVTADNVINLERRPREEGEGSFGASNGGERAERPERPVPAAAPAGGGRGRTDDTELDDLPF
jgi:single-strand DNA-binding protein